MSEEAAAKLRLRTRRAPAACSREPSPGRGTLTDKRSWFEKEDVNERDKAWILLLKDISQDFQCTNWQMVPSLPEFLGKSPEEEESLQKHDVFTIGMKDFPWVSFPSFCKEKCLKPSDPGSHQVTQSQTDLAQGQPDKLRSLPSTAERTCYGTITDQAKNTVGEDTKGTSKPDTSPKSHTLTQQSSTCDLVSLPSSAEACSLQQRCRGTAQNSGENRKKDREELQIHQEAVSFGETRYVPAEKKPPLVSVPGTEHGKETVEKLSEGSTLDSCPMCMVRFAGTLSQLDVDGHLARCLSESADDVMW
ncbi:Fanconi anemia core complex-associated protein 20 [Colius striatus]|uniref:Fanconi anemia core complex-associated protein 20 n=1 Tax=Colius striatus TaxID=57412 RepID=UPI002B1DED01|nr:Fanconi anemia core complex-associated protein 20 [Colius striatus]